MFLSFQIDIHIIALLFHSCNIKQKCTSAFITSYKLQIREFSFHSLFVIQQKLCNIVIVLWTCVLYISCDALLRQRFGVLVDKFISNWNLSLLSIISWVLLLLCVIHTDVFTCYMFQCVFYFHNWRVKCSCNVCFKAQTYNHWLYFYYFGQNDLSF